MSPIRVGIFHGSRTEVGLAHGEEFAPLIREVLDIYRLVLGRSDADLREATQPFEQLIRSRAPDAADEIDAIAWGAGLPTWQIHLLNSRSELMGVLRDGCTTIYDPRTGVLAQTWDWLGALEPLVVVLDIVDDRQRRIVSMTEPGIIAKIGMNCCGIGVSLNFLEALTPADGVPVHVLLAELLRCGDLDTTRRVVATLGGGRYAHVTVADGAGDATLHRFLGPVTRSESWARSGPSACTNHVEDLPATGGDLLGNSIQRLRTSTRLIADRPPLDVESAMDVLGDQSDPGAPIAAPYTRYHGVDVGTVATVAMDLRTGRFDVRLGPEQQSGFVTTLHCTGDHHSSPGSMGNESALG